jgi:dihydroorotase
MPRRWAISNVQVVTTAGVVEQSVLIEHGRVAALVPSGAPLPAPEVVDGAGLFLLPGVVDIHVHFREPGQAYKATYASESSAAAVGGVTTICDMPNNGDQAVTDLDRFRAKLAVAGAASRVDFGLYVYLVSADRHELLDLRAAGLMGLKWDMSLAGVEVAPGRRLPLPEEALPYFQAAADLGIIIGVHAEDRPFVMQRTAALRAAGRTDALAHLEARPAEAERLALLQVIDLVRASGARVHIHHLSSAVGLDLVRQAKDEGLPLTAETIPAFLFLDARDYPRLGTVMKIHPAVKDAADRDALWKGISDGSIDCIATDHAPHTREEKLRSVWDASPGVIGVQTSLVLLLDAVSRGALSLQRAVEVLCSAPARIYHLTDKGNITPGADADLVLVDLRSSFTLRNQDMLSPNRLTPYDGRQVQGTPLATWLRGELIAEDGHVVGSPHGRHVQPSPPG